MGSRQALMVDIFSATNMKNPEYSRDNLEGISEQRNKPIISGFIVDHDRFLPRYKTNQLRPETSLNPL